MLGKLQYFRGVLLIGNNLKAPGHGHGPLTSSSEFRQTNTSGDSSSLRLFHITHNINDHMGVPAAVNIQLIRTQRVTDRDRGGISYGLAGYVIDQTGCGQQWIKRIHPEMADIIRLVGGKIYYNSPGR